MACLLSTECLNEIFENLEDDKNTLYSCLLVNSLWCNISVRILWRMEVSNSFAPHRHRHKIINTLFACLPTESKELLHKNGIFILTPTSKPPLFNYPVFCKVLSIHEICELIDRVLKNNRPISSFIGVPNDIPGERDCLRDLSELHCSSNLHYDFFHQLSQICHNLRSLSISFIGASSYDGLKELISSQNNLKDLSIIAIDTTVDKNGLLGIIPALTKHSDTLIKLRLDDENNYLPLSFISSFYNLQEIVLLYYNDCKGLQYVTLPKLKAFKSANGRSNPKHVMKFLEINGKNLEEIYMDESDNALRSSIARFCPNLKKLFVLFTNDEVDILREIFNSCQYLESIKIWCEEVLEIVAKHSPKNFYELKIYVESQYFPEDLESFLVSWKNRTPSKSLNLIFYIGDNRGLGLCENYMKIIEKYKNLGVIKKFEIKNSEEENGEILIF